MWEDLLDPFAAIGAGPAASWVAVAISIIALVFSWRSSGAFRRTARVNAAAGCASAGFLLEETVLSFYSHYPSSPKLDQEFEAFWKQWQLFHAAFRLCYWYRPKGIAGDLPETIRNKVKADYQAVKGPRVGRPPYDVSERARIHKKQIEDLVGSVDIWSQRASGVVPLRWWWP